MVNAKEGHDISLSHFELTDPTESRRKTPIYLFRSSRPGLGSGIEVKDGNSVKMVPRACIDGSAAHDNVYLIPNLEAMVNSHLSGGTSIQSEFSSWAASSTVSAHFWALNNDPQARMSVIDTRKYTKTAIYHVPNLYDAGLSRKQYPHEHLLHGIVEVGSGSGYSSISWNEAISKDFDTLVPRPPCYWIPNHIKPLPQDQTISLLTKEEIEAAIRIASRFGPEFIIPLTASLLSHKPRSWRRPKSSFASQDVHAVAEALKQYPVADIEDYSKVTNVATDAVYALAYEEITQMNILLQLLAKHTLREKMEDRKKYEKKYDKNQAGKTSKKAKKSFRAGRTWTMCEF